MKRNISRESVESIIISDPFFEKGNIKLKVYQSVIAITGWITFFIPFIWLALPFIFPSEMGKFKIYKYFEEIDTFWFLTQFLTIIFVLLSITYVLLTLLNNYKFKNILEKRNQYNENRVLEREIKLNRAYTKRFGDENMRHNIRYYSVPEEKNLSTDFVKDIYENKEMN